MSKVCMNNVKGGEVGRMIKLFDFVLIFLAYVSHTPS